MEPCLGVLQSIRHLLGRPKCFRLGRASPVGIRTRGFNVPSQGTHNNLAEQQMKRIALGRKNYLFVGSQRGGTTAAILSSITSTCRRHEIDPQRYLTQLLANLPATPFSQLEQWLPDVWKRRQEPGLIADAHATT